MKNGYISNKMYITSSIVRYCEML